MKVRLWIDEFGMHSLKPSALTDLGQFDTTYIIVSSSINNKQFIHMLRCLIVRTFGILRV